MTTKKEHLTMIPHRAPEKKWMKPLSTQPKAVQMSQTPGVIDAADLARMSEDAKVDIPVEVDVVQSKSSVAAYQTKISELQSANKSLESQLSEMEKELSDAKTVAEVNSASDGELEKLTEERDASHKKVEELKDEIAGLGKKMIELEQKTAEKVEVEVEIEVLPDSLTVQKVDAGKVKNGNLVLRTFVDFHDEEPQKLMLRLPLDQLKEKMPREDD